MASKRITASPTIIDHLIEKIEAEMPRYPAADAIHNVFVVMRIAQAESAPAAVEREVGFDDPVIFEMFARDVRESRMDDLARDVRHLFGFMDTRVYSDAQLETLARILCDKYRNAWV